MSEDVPQYGEMNEQRAREILSEWINGDRLKGGVPWVTFVPGDSTAILDGHFEADELEAIAWWMRNKS